MKDPDNYLFVDSAQSLENLCAKLQDQDWLAVDTEFLRETTYFPKLCLLQIATPQLVACIDSTIINNIDSLFNLIYDKRITKVMHAARQDLEIFYHVRGTIPQPLFDCQLAAPLVGYPEQMSYAALVEALLGVHLNKAHTRTDWSRRPLSDAQLHYAADDVRYLARLYPLLRGKLEQLDRLTWISDDFTALTDPRLYERSPEQAWLRVKGFQHVRGSRLATLQALSAWRERTAQNEDRPRSWVLRDENLLDLAKIQPVDEAELLRIRGINMQVLRRFSEVLLKIIQDSKNKEPISLPAEQDHSRLTSSQEAVVDLLLTTVRVIGDQYGINPAVITNRKELDRLTRGDSDVSVLCGWRRKLAGETLVAVLRGDLSLRVADEGVHLIKTN